MEIMIPEKITFHNYVIVILKDNFPELHNLSRDRQTMTRFSFVRWCESNELDHLFPHEIWSDYIRFCIENAPKSNRYERSFKSYCRLLIKHIDGKLFGFCYECIHDDEWPSNSNATIDDLIDYITANWGEYETAVDSLEKIWILYKTFNPLS